MADSPLFAPLTAADRPAAALDRAGARGGLSRRSAPASAFAAVDPGPICDLHDRGDFRACALALERLLRTLGGRKRRCKVSAAASARRPPDERHATALRGFISGNSGVLAGLAILILGLSSFSSLTADGLPDLAEFLHRALSRRCADLHHDRQPRVRRQSQRLHRPDGAGHDVRRRLAACDGFLSGANIKSMLVFASFLGLATRRPDARRAARRPRPVDPLRHRLVECRPALSDRPRHSVADRGDHHPDHRRGHRPSQRAFELSACRRRR